MDKVKVEICCGTACYLLGAAKIMDLENSLPEELRSRVEIEARPCLNLCERENLGGAPYVRINDTEIVAKATLESVLKRVRELLEGVS